MLNGVKLHYTPAVVVSILSAALAVAVSFGLHLTQDNTRSILTLVGLIAAAVTIGGGVKSAAMIRAGLGVGNASFHFTPAVVVSILGAALAVAVSFGLNVSEENIHSIMLLVGLVAGGITVGGAAKSAGLFAAGQHPVQLAIDAQAKRSVRHNAEHQGPHARR